MTTSVVGGSETALGLSRSFTRLALAKHLCRGGGSRHRWPRWPSCSAVAGQSRPAVSVGRMLLHVGHAPAR